MKTFLICEKLPPQSITSHGQPYGIVRSKTIKEAAKQLEGDVVHTFPANRFRLHPVHLVRVPNDLVKDMNGNRAHAALHFKEGHNDIYELVEMPSANKKQLKKKVKLK